MIPYKDDNPTQTTPFVTVGIIVLNCLIYLWQIMTPQNQAHFAFFYGAIPHNIITFQGDQPIHPALTVFSSMFLHGGFLHLAGNMLYLWIFGNNIEDALGHGKFILFYLFSGVVAAYSHAITETNSMIPMIGASGAVSGILGAYLVLYPQARVYTILFFFIFWQIVRIPAVVVIGFWVIIQLINGIVSKGMLQQGGVAWFAHLGGFLAGFLTIKLWLGRRYR